MNISPELRVQTSVGSKTQNNMFYNAEFEEKINKVNEEFERMMKEHQDNQERKAQSPLKGSRSPLKKSPSKRSTLPDSPIKIKDQRLASNGLPSQKNHPLAYQQLSQLGPGALDAGDFTRVMDLVYSGKPKKHKSPTKRLMQQKNACWKHKEFLSKNIS